MSFFILPIAFVGLVRTRDGLFMGVPVARMLPFSLVAVLVALVFSLLNWRCPSCNRYLGRSMWPRYCSKCGAELR